MKEVYLSLSTDNFGQKHFSIDVIEDGCGGGTRVAGEKPSGFSREIHSSPLDTYDLDSIIKACQNAKEELLNG